MPKKILISEKEIISLYNNGLSQSQIADKLNVSLPTIQRRFTTFKIKARTVSEHIHLRQANHCVINEELKNILYGLLLSDGHLRKQGKNKKSFLSTQFSISMKHPDIPNFLSQVFDNNSITYRRTNRDRLDKRTNKIYHTEEINTRSYVELLPMRHRWYKNNKKIIPRDIVLNPTILFFWMIGDGNNALSNKTKCPHIELATQGFDIQYIMFIKDKLLQYISGLNITITKNNTLKILKDSVNVFIEECLKSGYSLPSYEYKFVKIGEKYNGKTQTV